MLERASAGAAISLHAIHIYEMLERALAQERPSAITYTYIYDNIYHTDDRHVHHPVLAVVVQLTADESSRHVAGAEV
eukprot:scaffold12489_cov145-Isochrysis_galbana.AAC.7